MASSLDISENGIESTEKSMTVEDFWNALLKLEEFKSERQPHIKYIHDNNEIVWERIKITKPMTNYSKPREFKVIKRLNKYDVSVNWEPMFFWIDPTSKGNNQQNFKDLLKNICEKIGLEYKDLESKLTNSVQEESVGQQSFFDIAKKAVIGDCVVILAAVLTTLLNPKTDSGSNDKNLCSEGEKTEVKISPDNNYYPVPTLAELVQNLKGICR